MRDDSWNDVISRITPAIPIDIDADLEPIAPKIAEPGRVKFSPSAIDAELPVQFADEETVCFGVRITKDTPNIVALAMQIAQMAAEKGAYPIVLAHVDYSGLERFGFRVERVAGTTPEEIEACEAQICAFWQIVLII